MKAIGIFICALMVVFCATAADSTTKPKLQVAADGFPSGHDTPEGAACDLARAFIKRDPALFTNTCVRLYGGGKARENYIAFLTNTVESMKQEAAKKEPSPAGPKSIGKVFAARHLTKDGPASYGYAAFDFQDVMFVDVDVLLYDGHRSTTRTLMIKDRDSKWYVHPIPSVSPLLSAGLNEETPSKEDFSETVFTTIVVVSITRGLFENVHEQDAGKDLCHRILFALSAICQVVKAIE